MTERLRRRYGSSGRRALLAGALLLPIAGCAAWRRRHRPAPPTAPLRYVVGAPYQASGVWRYPREKFDATETGLATALASRNKTLTDGAPYDPGALIAAHPTLQLPSVAEVTNLETGLSVAVRIDERGPEAPGRILALSPRALTLLGAGSEKGVLRVRLRVLEGPSRALADALAPDRDRLPVAAAPTGVVREEALPAPGTTGRPGAAPAPTTTKPTSATAAPVPLRLPEDLRQYAVRATSLFVDLGVFSRAEYARLLAGRMGGLGARVDTDYAGNPDRPFRVRIGPLASAAEADAVLDRTLAAGVSDARIVVDEE